MTIKESVSITYRYSSLFHFPLYPKELSTWLATSKPVKLSEIPPSLIKKVSKKGKQKRELLLIASQRKKLYAKLKLSFLKKIPLIRFVGVSGSVSVDNAKTTDDIDIFIITTPHTLWLTRPIVLFILELLQVRRRRGTDMANVQDLICPNLWLDINNLKLSQNRQNLFSAHEVLQVYPLINKDSTYEKFIISNGWARNFLANAYPKLQKSYSELNQESKKIKNIIYLFLAPLNIFFFLLQYLFMLPRRRGEELGLGKAFFHNPDYANKVLKDLVKKI